MRTYLFIALLALSGALLFLTGAAYRAGAPWQALAVLGGAALVALWLANPQPPGRLSGEEKTR